MVVFANLVHGVNDSKGDTFKRFGLMEPSRSLLIRVSCDFDVPNRL